VRSTATFTSCGGTARGPVPSASRSSRRAERSHTKFAGGSESGPFPPNSAISIFCPGTALRAITIRFGAFQPATTDPPRWPSARAISPSTQTSA
jgi:hypothetical protein